MSLELEVMYGALDVCGCGCVGVAGGQSINKKCVEEDDGLLRFLDVALRAMVVRVSSVDTNEVIM